MQFSDLLKQSSIKLISSASSKKRLFQELGDLAFGSYDVPAAEVVDALAKREALGPTGVGHGVALPHARLDSLTEVCGMFVRLEKPMDFDSVDKQPVDLVFALLAPTNAGVDHLKALALVSRTLRDAQTMAKLRANNDVSTLHTILTEAPSSAAA